MENITPHLALQFEGEGWESLGGQYEFLPCVREKMHKGCLTQHQSQTKCSKRQIQIIQFSLAFSDDWANCKFDSVLFLVPIKIIVFSQFDHSPLVYPKTTKEEIIFGGHLPPPPRNKKGSKLGEHYLKTVFSEQP